MKTLKIALLFFLVSIYFCQAQDTTIVLNTKQFKEDKQIALTALDGWIYKTGNDIRRAQKNQDHTDWKRMKPEALSGILHFQLLCHYSITDNDGG